jgi:hypothetical protein
LSITLAGVPFKGFVDLSIIHGRDVPFVSDHKTTSDLVWAKSADDLVDDVQATLYAADGMLLAHSTACDLQWTYGRTRGAPVSLPVVRRVTADEIAPRIAKTAATAQVLRELFEEQPHWLDVPYDASACDKFGGCPFRGRCNLTPQERIQSIMAQETQHSAFLNKLRAKRGNGAAPTTHPAPVSPTVPASAGVVNSLEAPATAATSPAPAPVKPPRKPRQPRAERAADEANAARAAERAASPDGMTPAERAFAAVPVSNASAGVERVVATPKPPEPVAPAVAPVSGNLIDMLNSQFVAGFKAGFEAGRS